MRQVLRALYDRAGKSPFSLDEQSQLLGLIYPGLQSAQPFAIQKGEDVVFNDANTTRAPLFDANAIKPEGDYEVDVLDIKILGRRFVCVMHRVQLTDGADGENAYAHQMRFFIFDLKGEMQNRTLSVPYNEKLAEIIPTRLVVRKNRILFFYPNEKKPTADKQGFLTREESAQCHCWSFNPFKNDTKEMEVPWDNAMVMSDNRVLYRVQEHVLRFILIRAFSSTKTSAKPLTVAVQRWPGSMIASHALENVAEVIMPLAGDEILVRQADDNRLAVHNLGKARRKVLDITVEDPAVAKYAAIEGGYFIVAQTRVAHVWCGKNVARVELALDADFVVSLNPACFAVRNSEGQVDIYHWLHNRHIWRTTECKQLAVIDERTLLLETQEGAYQTVQLPERVAQWHLNQALLRQQPIARVAQLMPSAVLPVYAANNDDGICRYENDAPHHYSFADMALLMRCIREDHFNYSIGEPQRNAAINGDEFGENRENSNRTVVSDPCRSESFHEHLSRLTNTVLGQHEGEKEALNNRWQQMPTVLIIPLQAGFDWCSIRIQLNFEARTVSVLWDMPAGEDALPMHLRTLLLPAIRDNMQRVIRVATGDNTFELADAAIGQYVKRQVQVEAKQLVNVGVVCVCNIQDFITQSDRTNQNFLSLAHYTVKAPAHRDYADQMQTARRTHAEHLQRAALRAVVLPAALLSEQQQHAWHLAKFQNAYQASAHAARARGRYPGEWDLMYLAARLQLGSQRPVAPGSTEVLQQPELFEVEPLQAAYDALTQFRARARFTPEIRQMLGDRRKVRAPTPEQATGDNADGPAPG